MLLYPMMDLPNLFVTARQAFVSVDREREVLDHPGVLARTTDGPVPGPLASIDLEDVGFGYRNDLPPALDGITFTAGRGERIAVVGPVGCGKTTLLRLLAGLVPPARGAYRLNGESHAAWDWPSLRAKIGYVPQESTLFSDTMGENVAFGRTQDERWVRQCLDVAQMGADLEHLPDGLSTEIGRKGTLVSGGQKQRIAIARALAGRPELLLLDDCTASLDAQNEDLFWRALGETSPDLTIFLVSHRLATIRRADKILVLDAGRLVDAGAHEELAERCETYREFLVTQSRKSQLGVEGGDVAPEA
jgi:ATP-binding cassette subfamily B protein